MDSNENSIKWFAARTRFGQELGIKKSLETLGIEHFIPTRPRKNYRGVLKEQPVIPNLVFIRASKPAACQLREERRLPINYLFDYANHAMMIVPDKQMEDFQRVFELPGKDGGLVDQPLNLGERIRVSRGALKGVEGQVLELDGKLYVVAGLCGFVYAKARIPRSCLERINAENQG